MPLTYSYPGVYVEEVASGVRTIVGVSTSNTAFIDFFHRGPVDRAVRVTSFEDFEPPLRRARPTQRGQLRRSSSTT